MNLKTGRLKKQTEADTSTEAALEELGEVIDRIENKFGDWSRQMTANLAPYARVALVVAGLAAATSGAWYVLSHRTSRAEQTRAPTSTSTHDRVRLAIANAAGKGIETAFKAWARKIEASRIVNIQD